MSALPPTQATQCPLLSDQQRLIDALGYVDTEYNDPSVQRQVQQQIRAEMTRFQPPADQYLGFLPDYAPTFADHPLLQREYERVSAGKSLDAIDTSRYDGLAPNEAADQVEAWEKALDDLRVSVEHDRNQVVNLELLQAYGSRRWKVRNALLDGLVSRSKQLVSSTREACDSINLKRKRDQELNVSKMAEYQSKVDELLVKNQEIQAACLRVGTSKARKTE